eukprot:CAMPEP_0172064972 /NCGR_PEP_ID=MMETSP1043-20130122/10392_1 /TAXON_ID=464988 /ORGANISM="Hemiselmis andersenii, Strain CCMP441" /LENGTH=140 /DNA_ID=CAMNT_0012725059 /DNA_START=32 /DNA_END=451 /DNA_ORIENTATION=-
MKLTSEWGGTVINVQSPDFVQRHVAGALWRCKSCFSPLATDGASGRPKTALNGQDASGALRYTVRCSDSRCGKRSSSGYILTFQGGDTARAAFLMAEEEAKSQLRMEEERKASPHPQQAGANPWEGGGVLRVLVLLPPPS